MPKPFVLPPNWKQQWEYHQCSYRGCDRRAPFTVLLGLESPLFYLCVEHEWEMQREREKLEQVWSSFEANQRLKSMFERLLVQKERVIK